jgi:hypothetical protein
LVYGIKIAEDERSLLQALETPSTTVIFDGHANFGLGPNFSLATHKTIDSFTNFGTFDATAIPLTPLNFRGVGTEPDVLSEFLGLTPGIPENAEAVERMAEEGWAYLVPDSGLQQVKGAVPNYPIPHMQGRWKFEASHGLSAGAQFSAPESGMTGYHYIDHKPRKYFIVSAPDSDLPPVLRYKTFFYNACSSGPHFIKNFKHGEFIYTNRTCDVFMATRLFVEGLVNGKATAEILHILESEDADQHSEITYESKNF